MKKILIAFVSVSLIATGCLKDKDNNYGIDDTEVKGIAFPKSQIVFGAVSQSTPQNVNNVVVGLNVQKPAATDVEYTVTSNPAALPAGLTPVPAAAFTIPTSLKIDAGQWIDTVPIVLTNSSLLDPTVTYGIALTINSVSSGYTIAENMKTFVITINIKNIYDGAYTVVSGQVTRYSAVGVVENPSTLNGSLAGNPDVYLITANANTVTIPPSSVEGGLFWRFGSNSMVAGIDGIRITVDPTNKTTATSAGNATFGNWAGHENSYDPATKTFKFAWRWNPATTPREYEIVLKYHEPRP